MNDLIDIYYLLNEINQPSKATRNNIESFIYNSTKNNQIGDLITFLEAVIGNDNKQNRNILDWSFNYLVRVPKICLTNPLMIKRVEIILDQILGNKQVLS